MLASALAEAISEICAREFVGTGSPPTTRCRSSPCSVAARPRFGDRTYGDHLVEELPRSSSP
jgi:hypothetical protein